MSEEWKDIPNYEGLYQISELGRVKNKKTQRILNPLKVSENSNLQRVCLYNSGKKRRYYIHKLVDVTFYNKEYTVEKNLYTNSEVSTIKSMYKDGYSDDEIAKVLNRSVSAIQLKRSKLDLVKTFLENRIWEHWEVEYLKKNYKIVNIYAMMERLGRSRSSILHKATRIGITISKRHNLTERKKQADNIQKLANQGYYAAEISKMLRISKQTIHNQIKEFELTMIDGHKTERYLLKREKSAAEFWAKGRG